MDVIWDFLQLLKKELIVMGTAALPIIELRGAIPVGIALGLNVWTTFIFAYIGALVPVPVLLFFLRPVMDYLKRTKLLNWFAVWLEARTRRKSIKMHKYTLLGLFFFVAVPLPTTGVWTGSMIAAFLNIRILHAFPVIALANLVAGLIVMFISYHIF